jgi:hypothetical protein
MAETFVNVVERANVFSKTMGRFVIGVEIVDGVDKVVWLGDLANVSARFETWSLLVPYSKSRKPWRCWLEFREGVD